MKSKWRCKEGCRGDRICPHLAKKLPSLKAGMSSNVSYEAPEDLANRLIEVEEIEEFNEFTFRRWLKGSGLNQSETEFILDRFVSGFSFEQLQKKYNFGSRKTAHSHLERILIKLKNVLEGAVRG
jgi:hypothetical protein